MKGILMGLLGAGAIGGAGVCGLCTPAASAPLPIQNAVAVEAVAADTVTVRLRIEGMTCGGCAISARLVLARLDGVVDAQVNYDTKLAVVRYDRLKVTPNQMIVALKEKLKYPAAVVEPKSES